MQISGMLHGARWHEFAGFPATEVLGLSKVRQTGGPALADATAEVLGKVATALLA